ncbi:MAG TPA: hypothetical protein PKD37_08270 [Oligoflexia bacterium]|nr:hypothetical protein [Oligoflexia bacterium]HMP27958.1 hypothetical protein [Oligoflexia bacterium]
MADNQTSGSSLPQFDMAYDLGSGYCPIKELMRAMILRAVEDYHCGGTFREDALTYMLDQDSDDLRDEYVFSFSSVCKYLGLDPAKTREQIINTKTRISTRRRAA